MPRKASMKMRSLSDREFLRRTKTTRGIADKDKHYTGRKKILRSAHLSRLRSRSRTSSSGERIKSTPNTSQISNVTASASDASSSADSSSVYTTESIKSISTVIDIQDHVEEVILGQDKNKQTETDGSGDGESCDDIFSKLLDVIQCFPQHTQIEPVKELYDTDFINHIMRIECILEQTEEGGKEEEEEGVVEPKPDRSSFCDTENLWTLPPFSDWNQEPLLLTATAGHSGMVIRKIRTVSSPSYFDTHSCSGDLDQVCTEGSEMSRNEPVQLPINNGKEHPMHSWVIDFETTLFAGTALFRIRDAKGWSPTQEQSSTLATNSSSRTSHDYFARHNRKFQMVVRGKFKEDVIMADCMAGLILDEPLATSKQQPVLDCSNCSSESVATTKSKRPKRLKRGKGSYTDDNSLPPKWALRAAVKVAGLFSPRMDADLQNSHPRILSPLCSTAQTITIAKGESISPRIEDEHFEPSLLEEASLINGLDKKPNGNAENPAQARKSAFDAIYDDRVESLAQHEDRCSPCFDQSAEYTFEFLQHLVDYNDLTLDLGRVVGKMKLSGALQGQPVRFSAVVKRGSNYGSANSKISLDTLDCLWSFDLWHQSLLSSGK